jgi:hypothetical protein
METPAAGHTKGLIQEILLYGALVHQRQRSGRYGPLSTAG